MRGKRQRSRRNRLALEEVEVRLSGTAVCPKCSREVNVFAFEEQPQCIRFSNHLESLSFSWPNQLSKPSGFCSLSSEPVFPT